MATGLQPYASAAGRLLVSVIFLLSGFMKIARWEETEAFMASHGMPATSVLLALAALTEVLGGLALLLGFQTRAAALLLFLYLIPTTLVFHNFWAYQGQEQQMQMINFLKNLAIMGGLLGFFAFGAGSLSLDAWLDRARLAPGGLWPRGGRPA